MRRTFLRAKAVGILFHGFEISAEPISDQGKSEADYLLEHPWEFRGVTYYHDGTDYQDHIVRLNLDSIPVRDNYCPPKVQEDQRAEPSKRRSQAFFAIWERLWEMWQLKREAAAQGLEQSWLLMPECEEHHQGGASKLHLEKYLGIHPHHHAAVTTFHANTNITCQDLITEPWAIRIWKAHQCLHQWICALANLDFTDVIPAHWVETSLDQDGEKAINSLTDFVSSALLAPPNPRSKELSVLTGEIRKRSQKAITAYLSHLPDAKGLLSLLPQTALDCENYTRLDFSIGLIQNYLYRIRLGAIESLSGNTLHFTEKERLRWENELSSYTQWRKCQLRKCYPEDFIKQKVLAEDRKSAGFRLLENQLAQNVISMPVSGGTTYISPASHPALGGMKSLQAKRNAIINTSTEAKGTRVPSYVGNGPHYGRPELPIHPDWDAQSTAIELNNTTGTLNLWLETVQRAGQRPIRIAAAGATPAKLHIGCKDVTCCPICTEQDFVPGDEWIFFISGFFLLSGNKTIL